jgi:hypothetical protein
MMPCHSSGVELGSQLRRSFDVGEQDRNLLSLAFQCTARREDLLGEVLRRVGARVGCGRRSAGGRNGTSLCARPHEDVALKDGDSLDLYQLVAELGERLRIEIELSAEGTQGYAPMALDEGACAVNCLEKAHLRLKIVGMRRTRLEVVRDRRPGRQIRARELDAEDRFGRRAMRSKPCRQLPGRAGALRGHTHIVPRTESGSTQNFDR